MLRFRNRFNLRPRYGYKEHICDSPLPYILESSVPEYLFWPILTDWLLVDPEKEHQLILCVGSDCEYSEQHTSTCLTVPAIRKILNMFREFITTDQWTGVCIARHGAKFGITHHNSLLCQVATPKQRCEYEVTLRKHGLAENTELLLPGEGRHEHQMTKDWPSTFRKLCEVARAKRTYLQPQIGN